MGTTPESMVGVALPSALGALPWPGPGRIRIVPCMVWDEPLGNDVGVLRTSGLATPSVPDSPPRAADIAKTILRGPFALRTWLAAASLAVSVVVGVWSFVVVGLPLIVAGALAWLLPMCSLALGPALRLSALLARFERRRVERLTGTRIVPAPLPDPPTGVSFRQRQLVWSRSTPALRLAVYQVVRFPITALSCFLAAAWWWNTVLLIHLPAASVRGFPIVFFSWHLGNVVLGTGGLVLGVVAGVVFVFLGAQVVRAASAVDVAVARALLGPSRSGQLYSEVRRLSQARALAVEAAEAERRRIERDLHDGVQPRLVSLAMELGLAKSRLQRDPDSVHSLLDQAHEEAKTALEDLRSLVRGIYPPFLDERGLDAALSALVAGCSAPVRVDVNLPADRRDRAAEAAAYFVVAEAITNITKHAQASKASVHITQIGEGLKVLVEDDGRGGAVLVPEGGLAGLRTRVAASDGTLRVTSPPGGPTRVEAVIPCAP